MKVETFNEKWSFGDFQHLKRTHRWKKVLVERNIEFLKNFIFGFTLNVCCGSDPSGDIKVDIDSKLLKRMKKEKLIEEYIVADLRHLPFKPNTFDCIICDPPFSYYNHFDWLLNLWGLTKKRLIISSPPIVFRLPNVENKELFYIETPSMFMRLWWVIDKKENKDQMLTAFF